MPGCRTRAPSAATDAAAEEGNRANAARALIKALFRREATGVPRITDPPGRTHRAMLRRNSPAVAPETCSTECEKATSNEIEGLHWLKSAQMKSAAGHAARAIATLAGEMSSPV